MWGRALIVLGVGLSLSPGAYADTTESELALPGLLGVELAETGRTGLAVAARAGYGFTEGVLNTGDSHHRVFGSLAVAVRPLRFLGLGLRLDGRYDKHVNGPSGSDDGLVGDPRLFVRYARPLNDSWSLGTQLLVWLPGGDEPPSIALSATSPELMALLSYKAANSPLVAALNLGFRLDRSAKAISNPNALSPEDRLALGLADAPTLLVGAGGAYGISDRLAIIGDLDADLLLGSNAPPASASPVIARVGARYDISGNGSWSLEGRLEAHLLGRADPTDNLGPVPPRIGFALGINYAPPRPVAAPAVVAPPPVVAPRPPKATVGQLKVKVTRRSKSPLAGAEISVNQAPGVRASDEGVAQFDDLKPGRASVRVSHPGYETVEIMSSVVAGETTELELSLRPDLPSGTVQGRVRNPKGATVSNAAIKVAPLGLELTTDNEGRFEVSLPPGPYTITIEAPGLRRQKRRINVKRDEVVVLNADLLRR